jgi:hypothetical protein
MRIYQDNSSSGTHKAREEEGDPEALGGNL